MNYPVGTEKVRDTIKTIYMRRIDHNPQVFLTTQNSRVVRDRIPLQGYVTEADNKRLESLRRQLMPPRINRAKLQSDKRRAELNKQSVNPIQNTTLTAANILAGRSSTVETLPINPLRDSLIFSDDRLDPGPQVRAGEDRIVVMSQTFTSKSPMAPALQQQVKTQQPTPFLQTISKL